jgi:hypothetical protein
MSAGAHHQQTRADPRREPEESIRDRSRQHLVENADSKAALEIVRLLPKPLSDSFVQ